MIDVLIVISGLVLFVPYSAKDQLSALLVETKYLSGGMHVPAMRQKLDNTSTREWDIVRGDFQATFTLMAGRQPPIERCAVWDFPQLSRLTKKPDDAKIRANCLDGTCVDGQGRKQVAALVNFVGGWQMSPLQRYTKQWSSPARFHEQAISDFRKASDVKNYKGDEPLRPFATALALEAEIEKLDDLKLVIHNSGGDVAATLQLSSPDICRKWLGDGTQSCIVIEVENWTDVDPDPPCDAANRVPPCDLDEHFSLLYDLIAAPPLPADRWLPYVEEGGKVLQFSDTTKLNKPAVRCPPGWAAPWP